MLSRFFSQLTIRQRTDSPGRTHNSQLLIVAILFFVSSQVFAQDAIGNITIIQDYKIDQLIEKHIEINKSKETEPGWRVQIMQSSDKNKVYKTKSDFYNRFREYPSYVSYWQPNFRLRVGDFKTRLEAYKCLITIQPHYEESQIVPDEINLKPEDR